MKGSDKNLTLLSSRNTVDSIKADYFIHYLFILFFKFTFWMVEAKIISVRYLFNNLDYE